MRLNLAEYSIPACAQCAVASRCSWAALRSVFQSWQGAHPLSLTGPRGHRHSHGRRHVLDAGQPSGEARNALKPPSLASQRPAFPTLSCPPLPACIDRAAPMRDPHIPVLLARLRVDPARPRAPSMHRTAAFLTNALVAGMLRSAASANDTPPMSGDDGSPPSSSGIAGGLRRPVNNTRGKPLILTVACATWGKPR